MGCIVLLDAPVALPEAPVPLLDAPDLSLAFPRGMLDCVCCVGSKLAPEILSVKRTDQR